MAEHTDTAPTPPPTRAEVISLCDAALRLYGLPTYSTLSADEHALGRARADAAGLRQAHDVVAGELAAAIELLVRGDCETGMAHIVEAQAFAEHHGRSALQALPAGVADLAGARQRAAQAVGRGT